MGKPKKGPREKDLTERFLSGGLDEDRVDQQQTFNKRSKFAQQNKTAKTAATRDHLRAEQQAEGIDVETLPVGEVVQVYSLFLDVEREPDRASFQATVRKTLQKVAETEVVVGDRVRFRPAERLNESGKPEAVIEEILPRRTVLTRAQSFKGLKQDPIVANADRMLIVASLALPRPKWGLVDRMLIAARAGGLEPVVVLNKVDLAGTEVAARAVELDPDPDDPADRVDPLEAIVYYGSIGVRTLKTSAEAGIGLDELRDVLRDKVTVLSGHSGVGKSSLIRAVEPALDLRIGDVSDITQKGRHTTTSARRYPLSFGGAVVDTPGVKVFGLWRVTRDNLLELFPDVENETAPEWRRASYERIAATVPAEA